MEPNLLTYLNREAELTTGIDRVSELIEQKQRELNDLYEEQDNLRFKLGQIRSFMRKYLADIFPENFKTNG